MERIAARGRFGKARSLAAGAGLALLLAMTGCGAFFQCEGKTSCGNSAPGSGNTGTGDYVYVSNSTTGSTYINGYTIGTATLSPITGFPTNLSYIPVAMKVSPNNNFLYVASSANSSSTAGLYVYPITSTGALGSGTQLVTATEFDTIDISPDGNFLFAIGPDQLGNEALSEFAISTSDGSIIGSGVTTFPLPIPPGTSCGLLLAAVPVSQECTVVAAPTGDYVAASLGQTGTLVYPYNKTTGIPPGTSGAGYTGIIGTSGVASGDYSVAFDGSDHLYVASTSALTPFSNLSAASPNAGTGISSGATPRSVTLSLSYDFIYTADEGSNQISTFSLSNGVLTQLGSSPQSGPAYVSALGVDRSGTYVLAAGYNSTNGLQMFTTSSTAGVVPATSAGTGGSTTIPIVMALTH